MPALSITMGGKYLMVCFGPYGVLTRCPSIFAIVVVFGVNSKDFDGRVIDFMIDGIQNGLVKRNAKPGSRTSQGANGISSNFRTRLKELSK